MLRVNEVTKYDVISGTATILAPLPTELHDMACVKWNNTVIVSGGRNKKGQGSTQVYAYDLQAGGRVTVDSPKRLPDHLTVRGDRAEIIAGG